MVPQLIKLFIGGPPFKWNNNWKDSLVSSQGDAKWEVCPDIKNVSVNDFMVPQLTEQFIGGPPCKWNNSRKDSIVSFQGDEIYDITVLCLMVRVFG